MLDERLIGTTFTLTQDGPGDVALYGIHYHYHVLDQAKSGDLVVVVRVEALGLSVRKASETLVF